MRIRIHRGTQEIGGTCIEVEAGESRIVLDVGLPLDAVEEESEALLPDVSGFRELDENLLGAFISHPHQDHYGLAKHLLPEVLVYIGEGTHNILKAASAYVPGAHYFENPQFISHRATTDIGPFRITPYLVDHSGFDSYALLVEADGKRVYYSGDFRGHGRKSQMFERLIERPPSDIDVLVMEGTTIGRAGSSEGFATENELEWQFVQAFRGTSGVHFVWTSTQNIDRLVTIFRAAKRTGRTLVIGLYTAVVLEAMARETIPQSDWEGVNLYIPHRQRVHIMENELFEDLRRHGKNRVFPEDLTSLRERAVMLFTPAMIGDWGVQKVLEGARFTYSMWDGYLADPGTQRVVRWLESHGIPWQSIHTSGHASTADLQRFADALAPRKLVPIHSFEGDRFSEFFDNVVQEQDGLWWEV